MMRAAASGTETRQWHITVRRGNRVTQLPMHGSHKALGIKLVNKILKDLGLK